MAKKFFTLGSICVLLLFFFQLTGCVSTQRPFKKVYTGETEEFLLNTRWELQDLKSSDNFTLIVEFGANGAVFWYNTDSFNKILSEASTWKRDSNDVVFNAYNGYYLYEGKIDTSKETPTITGRYKTGHSGPLLKTYPTGDFIMTKEAISEENFPETEVLENLQ
jgi:hypothetical protein